MTRVGMVGVPAVCRLRPTFSLVRSSGIQARCYATGPLVERSTSAVQSSSPWGTDVKKCWEYPLLRKNTWSIIAPDARILNTDYRNEPDFITPTESEFTETGIRIPQPVRDPDPKQGMTYREVFSWQKSDFYLLITPFFFFTMYIWR